MDKDAYVHCLQCNNLKIDIETKEYPLSCEHEGVCDFFDPEDGRRFSERPFYVNREDQYYIDSQTCCACVHFHWGMGEMGTCDLREYKTFNDIGEWSDICSIGKFEHNGFTPPQGDKITRHLRSCRAMKCRLCQEAALHGVPGGLADNHNLTKRKLKENRL